MAEKKIILTKEGLKKLEDKLENLKSVRRIEVAERIKQAIDFGDISENSEYDDAKNEQSRLEAQIMELENTLRTAIVIDESNISTDRVNIGTTVRILDLGLKEEEEFTIVGARESDPNSNKISNESPLGAALLGKKKGEKIKVQVPSGTIDVKIIDIHR